MDSLAEVFVLGVVGVVPLDVLAEFPVQFFLDAAVNLDGLVGDLDGLEHDALGHLVHLTLYHHYVFFCGGDHQVEVGLSHLGEVGVDLELTVDPCYADLGNRAQEGDVAGCECAGCGKTGECIGLDVSLGGEQPYVHKDCEMEIIREKGPECPVDESCNEHLVVGCLAFPFHESSGIAACGVEFFFVVHLKWEEVSSFICFLCTCNSREKHRASHPNDCGTVCLLGNLASLDFNCPTVGQ